MRKHYLEAHRPALHMGLFVSDGLNRHLAEINQACEDRLALMIQQMKVQENVTESLKAADQMEWVRRMNNIRSRAEEIVLHELVYC